MDQAVMPTEVAPAEAAELRGEFTGTRGGLFKLLVVNLVLTILTLGIYRFWAKTKLRQFFWNNSRIGGDAFEYTGTALELFKGFLIAVAVLAPFGLTYHFLSGWAATTTTEIATAVDVAYYATIGLLIQFAVYRMWRYRLTRTRWRGVRADLDGSAGRYVVLSTLWGLLSIATLGLAAPWAKVALMRYRTNHTRFGSELMSFHGSARRILLPWLLLFAPILIGFGVLFMDHSAEMVEAFQQGRDVQFEDPRAAGIIALLMLGTPIFYAWYKTAEFRMMINDTRLGKVTFECDLFTGRVIGYYILTGIVAGLLMMMLTFMVGGVVLGMVAAASNIDPETLSFVSGFLFFLGFLFIAGTLSTLIIRFGLTKTVVNSLVVSNPDELDRIIESAGERMTHGEGLADAFDVGAI